MEIPGLFRSRRIDIKFVRKGGWLEQKLRPGLKPSRLPVHELIEQRADEAAAAGPRPLWEGYQEVANYPRATIGSRTSDQVRTKSATGQMFTWLASAVGDPTIIEFGTAFGVSGMYWLAGIGEGHLYTFEPNEDWANYAAGNLAAISPRHTLTRGTFEENGPDVIKARSADIAFIDAIHTSEFVYSQFEILKPLMKNHALILFDDINFSDDMRQCWTNIASSKDLTASATLNSRVGIIELN